MKIVTIDYGCGTSSSILDYGIKDIIIVDEKNYNHVFEVEDDLFFIGHDFLFFLWDDVEKLKKWQLRKDKWEHWVWCFERMDAIVPVWKEKSHNSLRNLQTFCSRFFACDEDDCDKYNVEWLPQWASNKFYLNKDTTPMSREVLFSGQAAKPEYETRTILLNDFLNDNEIKNDLRISNISRNVGWDFYIANLLNHTRILNPLGTLKALNTRAYEAIYSGRLCLQQTFGRYERHEKLLKDVDNIIFFENFSQLKEQVIKTRDYNLTNGHYEEHSFISRMKSIGLDFK